MRKVRVDLTAAVESAAQQYDLTPAEAKVLAAVIQAGGGVEAVAARLGVSRSTIKTHLERVFKKTGIRRQAGLVKLLFADSGDARDTDEQS